MRELKFRAWDKDRNKYHFGCSNIMLDLGGLVFWQFGDNPPEPLHRSSEDGQFIIEQCTGLHDKNGKEIYEGDIVKVPWGWGGDNEYEECIAEVEWLFDEAGFSLNNPKDRYGLVMQDWSWSDLEVIGNIHEHPDLLKEERT